MFRISPRPALLAGALALTCCTAHANSVDARASITDFHYELVDLDLKDGISPSIIFLGAEVAQFSLGGQLKDQRDDYGATSVLQQFGAANSFADATSSFAASRYAVDGSFPLQFAAGSRNTLLFRLSANTELRLSASGAVQVDDVPGDLSSATIWIDAALGNLTAADYSTYSQHLATSAGSREVALNGSVYSGGAWQSGHITMWARTQAIALASPVPEPATYAMLLAGLGLLAYRRRKTGSA